MSNTNQVLLEYSPCPMGCATHDHIVLKGTDILHNMPGEFTVVSCAQCGLMRTNPKPSIENMSGYYPDDYGPYISTKVKGEQYSSSLNLRNYARTILAKSFNFRNRYLPNIAPGRMLEIGCASGSFLNDMAKKGWLVEGIEFSDKAAHAASESGFKVHAGSIETSGEPEYLFDLIVGWMVVEHLQDPVASLKKLRSWAAPNTWLVLSLPNAGSLEFKIFKERWYALQLPTHLYHFSPHTIKKVLESSGWDLKEVYHHRILTNLVCSLGYYFRDIGLGKWTQNLIDFPRKPGRLHYYLYPISLALSLFGQTGRMTIWAQTK